MSPLSAWVRSDDAVLVLGQGNGHGRGDGYDCDIYRSRATGRYLVRVDSIGGSRLAWYVCPTEQDARGIIAQGWTPGYGPGKGELVTREGALRETRTKANA